MRGWSAKRERARLRTCFGVLGPAGCRSSGLTPFDRLVGSRVLIPAITGHPRRAHEEIGWRRAAPLTPRQRKTRLELFWACTWNGAPGAPGSPRETARNATSPSAFMASLEVLACDWSVQYLSVSSRDPTGERAIGSCRGPNSRKSSSSGCGWDDTRHGNWNKQQ